MRGVQLIQTLYFNAWRWKFLLIVAGICATVPEGLHSLFEKARACERQKTAVTGRERHPRMYDSMYTFHGFYHFISQKEKNLHHIPAGFEHSFFWGGGRKNRYTIITELI